MPHRAAGEPVASGVDFKEGQPSHRSQIWRAPGNVHGCCIDPCQSTLFESTPKGVDRVLAPPAPVHAGAHPEWVSPYETGSMPVGDTPSDAGQRAQRDRAEHSPVARAMCLLHECGRGFGAAFHFFGAGRRVTPAYCY